MDLFETLTPTLKSHIWVETSFPLIKTALLRTYNPEIVQGWGICDISFGIDGEVLVKWFKREIPLTEEELAKIF